jgi:hypothetical protein
MTLKIQDQYAAIYKTQQQCLKKREKNVNKMRCTPITKRQK